MSKNPVVSYIITTFDSEEYIQDNIESIRNQDYDNQEIIVVDNCSSDSTREIIEEKFPEIKLIVLPNSDYGACETFNIGFETAKGEYIAILDDDVELPENWTSDLVQKFSEEDENLAILQPEISEINQTIYTEEEYLDKFKGCGVLAKKKHLREVGYFDKNFFIFRNDFDLGHKLVCNGYQILNWPEVKTIHKTESLPGNSKSSFRQYYDTRNQLWIIWKYYDLKNAVISTFYRITRNFMFAAKSGTKGAWAKGVLGAFRRFPKYAVRERSPCKDLNYRRWSFREILSSVKNIRKHF